MRELLEGVVAGAAPRRATAASAISPAWRCSTPPTRRDLPDDLHPNAAGYRRMGERFHAQVLSDGRWLAGETLG